MMMEGFAEADGGEFEDFVWGAQSDNSLAQDGQDDGV
jgi:hypothetical protein